MLLEILISVLIVSSVAAALALLLVISDKYINNYGPCKVTINKEKELTVEGGRTLLATLQEEKILVPSACGGRGTCGVCKLKSLDGFGPLLPTEAPLLSKQERAENVRLSCQIKVRNDVSIEIPDELFRVKEFQSRCAKIEELTYDMRRFRFELIEPDTISFTAGQFVQLICPKYKGSSEEVSRAYSIASDPADDRFLDLIIRRVPNGICTTWCFDHLKEGDTVCFNGPYGDFRLSDTDAPMIFIAGGSGMAPFISILHYMRNTNSQRKATYFFGGNTTRDLCLDQQMKEFEDAIPNFKFVPVVSRPEENNGWNGETGLVTQAVERNFKDLRQHEGYLCGSPGMIDASVKVFTGLGMPEDKVYYDKFA